MAPTMVTQEARLLNHAAHEVATPDTSVSTATNRRASLLRLFSLLGTHERLLLFVGLLAMIVASVSAMALPVYAGVLVSTVVNDDKFPGECRVDVQTLAQCRRERLRTVLLVMGVAFAVGGVALFLAFYSFELAGERLSRRLRTRLFASYVRQAIAFFDEQSTGELMNRLASDCTAIQDTLTKRLGEGLHYVVLATVGLTMMVKTSPVLTLVALCTVPLIAAFACLYAVLIMKLSERYQSALAKASEVAQETLSAIRTVRSFAAEERELKRYDSSIMMAYLIGAKRARATGAFIGLVSAVAQLALVVVLGYGCERVIDGELDFGELTSFLLLAIYVIGALGGMMDLFSALMSAVGASKRIFILLDMEPSLPLHGGITLLSGAVKGHLQLDSVSFAYPSRMDVVVLRSVSLVVEPGNVVALCGASGGGKSSILALLQRWYDPSSGAILVDGIQLNSLDPSWWRQQIALVAQEPVLFSGSILDNLRYGKPDAGREDAIAAAVTANAESFIDTFPETYATHVGERGVQLSGGQKQRIAIARALIVDPKVLLLDEATSALDAASEALVQAAIDKLMADRTTVVVAHRLSTIRQASCIYVMQEGCVVEKGTHEVLMAKQAAYAELVGKQVSSADGQPPSKRLEMCDDVEMGA